MHRLSVRKASDMEREEVRAALGEVFEQVFGRPVAVRDALTAADVEGWDSLAHVTLMLAIERRFGVRFTGGEIASGETCGDLIELIGSKS